MSNEHLFVYSQTITRRQFLVYSGLSVATLGLGACANGALPTGSHTATLQASETGAAMAGDVVALEFSLTARKMALPILPGKPTQVLNYAAELLHGDPGAVVSLPGSYLGPVVYVQRGQTLRVHLRNELEEPTNVHWHGLIVPAAMDGHPSNVIAPGGEATVEFEVRNRPGTYWFHPHPHERTAEQAYGGLAGLVIVSDADEAALGLPSGAQDIPLVIQDRRFDGDNQLLYVGSGMAGMMDQMMGWLGDRILVNGQPDARLPVATQPYRLRLLNGSNARIYKLGWSNGDPVTVIATDGGLLEQPVTLPYAMLSPGERIELWADFSQIVAGSQVKLVSMVYEGVEAGGMAMMMGEPVLPNGAAFDIVTFDVTEAISSSMALPATLLPIEMLSLTAARNKEAPRTFVFAMDEAMNWTINGRRYEMDAVAEDEQVRLGDTEVWELTNLLDPAAAGSMRDFMAHPVHLHGAQFQVLERQVDEAQSAGWETVKEGLVDQGWKDTVLVMPGERVRVLLRFDGYRGVYLFHCHNLEHEDGGMMRNFEIV
jgi:FtsP/CotA-like multicopper oxidase with cupredoxin domain